MRRRRRGSGGSVSRRKLLLGAGAALCSVGLTPTGAVSQVAGDRSSRTELASNTDAYLSLNEADTVKKNDISDLVTVKNQLDQAVTVTVSLVGSTVKTNSDLYLDPTGNSQGDSVTFTLDPTIDQVVYVETSLSKGSLVDWKLEAATSEGINISTDGNAEVTTGNNSQAVKTTKFGKLSVDTKNETFTVGKAGGKETDNDDDLSFAKYYVEDPNDNRVGKTKDTTGLNANNDKYNITGSESVTFSANDGVNLTKNTTYTFYFKLVDSVGNFAIMSKDVTA